MVRIGTLSQEARSTSHMISAAAKALADMFSAPFRAVLLKSLGLTLLLLVLAIVAIEIVFGVLVTLPGWAETAIQIVGGLGLVIASVFLVGPIAALIAGLHVDAIAATVERTHYPGDPPGKELGVVDGLGVSLKFGLAVVAANIVALLLLLVPLVNIAAFFLANGYLLGREFFELAAMRHMPPAEASAFRRANRLRVLLSGMLIALLVSIPLANLLTPLFATAFMMHTVKDVARRASRGP